MDVEKTIQFILEQAAHNAALIRALGERQAKNDEQIARHDEQTARLTEGVARLTENQMVLTNNQRLLTESQINIIDAHRRTDEQLATLAERVNALAGMFEEWLRRSGNGSRPS